MCEGTAMGAIVLDLRPGIGIGPFSLGMPISEAFAQIEQQPNIYDVLHVKYLDEETGCCGFFEWCDKNEGTNNLTTRSQSHASNPSTSGLSCPCGAGSCIILTAKTGKNIGQTFYRCPANQLVSKGIFKMSCLASSSAQRIQTGLPVWLCYDSTPYTPSIPEVQRIDPSKQFEVFNNPFTELRASRTPAYICLYCWF